MLIGLIISLLLLCCPPAIVFAVITIVIDSIKSSIGRLFSHILQKVFEGFVPSLTDRNSFFTIPCIISPFRIITPSAHVLPNVISICSRVSMWFRHLFLAFLTLGRFSPSKFGSRNNTSVSTSTLTLPVSAPFRIIWNKTFYSPISKDLSSHIFKIFTHKIPLNCISNHTCYGNWGQQ